MNMGRKLIVPPPEGVYEDIIEEIYFAWDVLSNSQLRWMHRSPAYFNFRKYAPEPKRDSKAQSNMDYGKAIHSAILEPHRFDSLFCERPEGNANSNAFKAKKSELEEEGFTLLKADQLANAQRIRDQFFAIPTLGRDLVMEATATEVSYVGEVMGVSAKCRVDCPVPAAETLLELKTSGDISDVALMRRTSDLNYDQAKVFYQLCVDSQTPGVFEKSRTLWIQQTEPFETRLTFLGEKSNLLAEAEMRPRIDLYAWCAEHNQWPGYADMVTEVNVPGYRFYQGAAFKD